MCKQHGRATWQHGVAEPTLAENKVAEADALLEKVVGCCSFSELMKPA